MVKLKKVIAKPEFVHYRNLVLGLPKKDYRALQAGKTVSIPASVAEKYKEIFEGVKDGD